MKMQTNSSINSDDSYVDDVFSEFTDDEFLNSTTLNHTNYDDDFENHTNYNDDFESLFEQNDVMNHHYPFNDDVSLNSYNNTVFSAGTKITTIFACFMCFFVLFTAYRISKYRQGQTQAILQNQNNQQWIQYPARSYQARSTTRHVANSRITPGYVATAYNTTNRNNNNTNTNDNNHIIINKESRSPICVVNTILYDMIPSDRVTLYKKVFEINGNKFTLTHNEFNVDHERDRRCKMNEDNCYDPEEELVETENTAIDSVTDTEDLKGNDMVTIPLGDCRKKQLSCTPNENNNRLLLPNPKQHTRPSFLRRNSSWKMIPGKRSCVICLEAFCRGTTVVWSESKACKHVFCEGCIVDYLSKINRKKENISSSNDTAVMNPCPVCRREFIYPQSFLLLVFIDL